MASIFSYDFDLSTSNVIDWLLYEEEHFSRLNTNDTGKINNLYLNVNDAKFLFTDLDNKKYELDDFAGSLWYRRGSLDLNNYILKIKDKEIESNISTFLDREKRNLEEYFAYIIVSNCKWVLNKPEDYNINKLIVLNRALKLGINIPETIITTTKNDLSNFLIKHNASGIITKPISDILQVAYKGEICKALTQVIDAEFIKKLPDFFFPSLFQKKIEKIFEVRAFFLNNKFYSMAIFSQQNPETTIDFRNYSSESPNRTVPYKLNKQLENKLKKLMKEMNLNSGSIDLIVSKDTIYFLEINPVGQYGMVSFPCNYYLDKVIANALIEKNGA